MQTKPMMILKFVLLLICVSIVYSFTFQSSSVHRSSLSMVKPGSYLEQLEAARRAKLGLAAPTPKPSSNKVAISTPKPQAQTFEKPPAPRPTSVPVAVAPLPLTDDQSEGDDLPFSDETYEHIKVIVNTLTKRMKSDDLLTPEALKKLRASMDAVIEDARQEHRTPVYSKPTQQEYNQPKASVTSQVSRQQQRVSPIAEDDEVPEEVGKGDHNEKEYCTHALLNMVFEYHEIMLCYRVDNPFKEFRGSSWNIPGMEKMTTEQYYDAVNQKLHEIRQKRKADGSYSRSESEDYFAQLNRKGREQRKPSA